VVNIVDKEKLGYAAFFVYYSKSRSDAVFQIDRMVQPRSTDLLSFYIELILIGGHGSLRGRSTPTTWGSLQENSERNSKTKRKTRVRPKLECQQIIGKRPSSWAVSLSWAACYG
jgi:hypothetical protein